MNNVAIITFHASHNYGSMLQAYALQNTVSSLGYKVHIINLRTPAQKKIYQPSYRHIRTNNFIKGVLRKIVCLPHIKSLNKKNELFETFLKKELPLTKEYGSANQFGSEFNNYDYYICGSDQIWNTACSDFDWAYFLNFTQQGHKISYATSMGPTPFNDSNIKNKLQIKELVSQIDAVSVREAGTADFIGELTGKTPDIVLDPTMLLTANQWTAKLPEDNKKKPYIFVYTPHYNLAVYETAKAASRISGLPVINSNFIPKAQISYNFKSEFATGPWEFLQLIKNAELVISGSFHAVLFSILFNRPFYAVNGMKDSRMANILSKMNMTDRAIVPADITSLNKSDLLNVDFSLVDNVLSKEREQSINFLKNALK